jgi:hypothetical protein
MAYSFLKAGTNAAQLVSPHTQELLANPSRVPTFRQAGTNARNWLKTSRAGATGLYSTCMLANDDIAIVLFGKRSMQRVIWNFGRA